VGFVRGLGFGRGAVASTVAHDAHNLVVIGGSDAEMALAANRASELGGGLVAVLGEHVLAELALPVAGLMSPAAPVEVAQALADLNAAAAELRAAEWMGSAPVSILTFLPLTAAHPLLITDLGFVDVEQGQPISLFA
jgi:adenine deaminase